MSQPNISKPPYLLGLLCLIPLVGAFVGLGLLLYGIFRYRNKLLSIIGASGILFSILFYFILFQYLNSSAGRSGFSKIAQENLNNLCKQIEFYKLEHGHYPDSLTALQAENKSSLISDPTQKMFSKNSLFNYKNQDSVYLLFSSGVDEIPNTKYDIYPNNKSEPESKIQYHYIPQK